MASLLITGGAGFIGANFVHAWHAHHPADHLLVLDALTYAGNLSSIRCLVDTGAVTFVRGDINDTPLVQALLREHAVDTIVHLAAESHVDRSIASPGAFVTTNVNGTHSLLEAARHVWLAGDGRPHRFHHVSTDEVFGALARRDDPPLGEGAPYAPNSPYAASKAAADFLVRAYHRTYGLQTTISHCSNNYGPYQFPEKLIPLMVTRALCGQRLPVYGRGGNVRDWLHVRDHCAGIARVIARGMVGASYNIGSGDERTNLDLVHALCALLDARFAADAGLTRRFPAAPPARGRSCADLLTFVADRPGHDFRYALDASRLRDELGFAPTVRLEDEGGLAATVGWYLDHADWWERVLDGSYRTGLPPLCRGAPPGA